MLKYLMLLLVVPLILFGGNLTLKNGLIKAHTEVFGDSSIDPSVSSINADLMINNNNLNSINGTITFNIIDLKSSNDGRDEHMQDMFEMKKYANISLKINSITKEQNSYVIDGIMSMHGVNKPVKLSSSISKNADDITIQSNFIVKVSDYGIEPPSLLFFTVRDAVDINASLTLKE